jgi:hypothetical protein
MNVRDGLPVALPVGVVVADAVPRLLQQRVVAAAARLEKLHHAKPVTQLDAHVDGQVPAVHTEKQRLGLFEIAEIHGHFRLLLARAVHLLQPLDKLDALEVLRAAQQSTR